jgi:hypothetical protein
MSLARIEKTYKLMELINHVYKRVKNGETETYEDEEIYDRLIGFANADFKEVEE